MAIAAILILGVTALGPWAAGSRATTSDPSAPLAFTMKDQFEREYTETYCAGRTAIVFVADRKGSAYVGAWNNAIARELKAVEHPPTRFVGVATLSSTPSFMRGMVRRMFGKDESRWTLLDWQGYWAKTYHLPAEQANILVFGPDRQLRLRTGGRDVDPAVVSSIVASVIQSGGAPEAAPAR